MFSFKSTLHFGFYFFCFFFHFSLATANLSQETIYLTWQHNPSTSMTIQWISYTQEKQSIVLYHPKKENVNWIKVTGEKIPFPHCPRYLIHQVEITNLQPNTQYTFKVFPYEKEWHFLTAPAHLEKDLHFVVGGDMYHDAVHYMARTCQKAAQTSPAFAVIGGDIAYAVQSTRRYQNFQRWIDWIKVWHSTMITPQGNLIPVIAAVGNHDVIGQYDQTPSQAAVFSALFPMPGKQIYNVLDFNSYLTILLLDSGHANPIPSQQNWLARTLNERKNVLHRLAVYHVPAYPSVRNYNTQQSVAIRNFWVPLFEQGGIQVVFEHHDHAYKRTYPLLNNRIHPKGIVFLGDGGWGVARPRKSYIKHPYLAKIASVRHFISVTLTPSLQNFKCIDDLGRVMDEYTKPVNVQWPNVTTLESNEDQDAEDSSCPCPNTETANR